MSNISEDPDSPDLIYYWDFGDGGTGQGLIVNYTYLKIDTNQEYIVTLTVFDGQMQSDVCTGIIVIQAFIEEIFEDDDIDDDNDEAKYTAMVFVGIVLFMVVLVIILILVFSMKKKPIEERKKRKEDEEEEIEEEEDDDESDFDPTFSYYEFLGVERDSSRKEIRIAYRKMSKKMHPDKIEECTPDQMGELKRNKVTLNKAKETLLDPEKREEYDKHIGSSFIIVQELEE